MIIIKKLILLITIILGIAGLLLFNRILDVEAGDHNGNGHIELTLCHARPPDTAINGWRQITIDDDGGFEDFLNQFRAHNRQHDADIIPPIGEFGGKNWDEEGQAIYRNGCEVPVRDLCENLDGVQSELPPNYQEEEGQCSCQEGYHQEEYGNGHEYDVPECVPDEEEPEPEVPQEPVVQEHGASAPPPVCDGRDLGGWAPTITNVGVNPNDPSTRFAEWTESTPNADDYILYYGLSEDNLPWNKYIENSRRGEVTLEEQYDGRHVWFRVASTDSCVVGNYSEVVDP